MIGNQSNADNCIFCQKNQRPNGSLVNGVFDCTTCNAKYSANKSLHWREDLIYSLVPIFDASLSEDVLFSEALKILKEKFQISKAAIFKYDEVNNCVRLRKYLGAKRKGSALTKLFIGLNDENHPIVKSINQNSNLYIQFSEFETMNEKVGRYFKFYKTFTNSTSSYLVPMYFESAKFGILSIDFEKDSDYQEFQPKEDMVLFLVRALIIILNNSFQFHKYNNKYLQFQNVHNSGLTLNKLYLNNTQEIIRMTLLTFSSLIETEVNLLYIYNKKYKAMTVYKLVINLFTKDLNLETIDDEESDVYLHQLTTSKPKLLMKEELKDFRKYGFTGAQLLILPNFELSGNQFSFVLGRNSIRLFSPDEIEILYAYSDLVRITIDNSYLYHGIAKQERLEKEVEIARDIQTNLLPRETPENPNYEFAGFMLPAREIGGDYYDFIESPDGTETLVAIGDVSGKGIPAGMVMATARTIIHSIVRKNATLDEIVEELNSYIYDNYRNSVVLRFMTLTLLRINHLRNEVEYKGGGHGNMLVYRTKYGDVKTVTTGGMLLGISMEIPDSGGVLKMEKGDVILLYTDGASEAMNKKEEQFEEERIVQSLSRHSRKSAKEILLSIHEDIQKFTNNSLQSDDVTLVAIKRR